ncbi:mannose-6-phosphate isomerase [Erythrobacter arachoides]|uniref:Mannose-6-phosphate isomerase n=1 Tax=Aurantiacibacter arachoides TaxID=1850444 RepID=A0A844ZZ06_9SPHN|nr:class I mannose-6-phosphate isomerase [Aurantiacibacter arachoides]MXO92166.1 mannose-6-phosphate isomerase [Aurantiacibacter arachoides]GGD59165.1 hypothetical protein GCM10011411_19240 [Aurantiacibacter arachoides]
MILPVRVVEKVWGRAKLPPPFDAFEREDGEKIGEIWFEPPEQAPELLIKYLFTSEKLSIQNHPSDTQTEAKGLGKQGKEECWLVVAAEEGATLGIGFREELDEAAMREAALDGSIEDLLVWHPVQVGDFFYIPANTVHAIGPGCSIIEIQQNSDITYRLYDYGRPRELHLDEGLAVADGSPYPANLHQRLPEHGHASLVDGPFFRLDYVDGEAPDGLRYCYPDKALVIPLAGEVLVEGELLHPGECAYASGLADVTFAPEGRALVAAPLG